MPEQNDTELGRLINGMIAQAGPMSLSTYMQICLTHPTLGYYTKSDPLGIKGDFITAPEISQMFGEMIARWVLMQWQALDCAPEIELVELGPGRGTLMADIMRALRSNPEISRAISATLIETSPALRAKQQDLLASCDPRWIGGVDGLDQNGPPIIAIANEFFDALPVKQFQKSNGAWRERRIGLGPSGRIWGLSPTAMPDAVFPEFARSAEEGAIWETSEGAQQIMRLMAALLARRRGGMIVFDYGHTRSRTGDTFQSLSRHEPADPLGAPGMADLTAHVDFEALADAAKSAGVQAQIAGTQAEVLAELGIRERAHNLIAANPQRRASIEADLERLVGPEQMGNLFKVLVAQHLGVPPAKAAQ